MNNIVFVQNPPVDATFLQKLIQQNKDTVVITARTQQLRMFTVVK